MLSENRNHPVQRADKLVNALAGTLNSPACCVSGREKRSHCGVWQTATEEVFRIGTANLACFFELPLGHVGLDDLVQIGGHRAHGEWLAKMANNRIPHSPCIGFAIHNSIVLDDSTCQVAEPVDTELCFADSGHGIK